MPERISFGVFITCAQQARTYRLCTPLWDVRRLISSNVEHVPTRLMA